MTLIATLTLLIAVLMIGLADTAAVHLFEGGRLPHFEVGVAQLSCVQGSTTGKTYCLGGIPLGQAGERLEPFLHDIEETWWNAPKPQPATIDSKDTQNDLDLDDVVMVG